MPVWHDAGEDIGQPGLQIDTVHVLAVTIRLYIAAAPANIGSAERQDFCPRAMPCRSLSAALLDRHTRAVLKEQGEGRPAFQHVVDGPWLSRA